MKKLKFLCIFLFLVSYGFAQKRNNIWELGLFGANNMGIDFNSGTADTFSIIRPMYMFMTNASICDSNGQILFYSNGQYIANKNNDTLFNSSDFNPGYQTFQTYGLSIPQACLIIPFPDDSLKYFVIHESAEQVQTSLGIDIQPFNLSYSIIDMTIDNGLGGIINNKKDIHLIDDTLTHGRVIAAKHGNGRDWWIICHEYESDRFYKFLITPLAILGPYDQQIGSIVNYSDILGQAIFSPDGNHFAMAGPQQILDVLDFDRCTGNFYNYQTAIIPDTFSSIGCSFSPNGRFVYVSTYNHIFQYDMWAGNLSSSGLIVATWDSVYSPFATNFFLQQLAPDGYIYLSTWGGTNILHYIQYPDSFGIACQVIQNSFIMPSYNTFGFPNSPNWDLGPETGSSCDSLGLGIQNLQKQNFKLEVFPNPNNGYFKISYSLPQNKEGKLEIYNLFSEKIYETHLSPWSSLQYVHLPFITAGVYVIKIESDGRFGYGKFVKE